MRRFVLRALPLLLAFAPATLMQSSCVVWVPGEGFGYFNADEDDTEDFLDEVEDFFDDLFD